MCWLIVTVRLCAEPLVFSQQSVDGGELTLYRDDIIDRSGVRELIYYLEYEDSNGSKAVVWERKIEERAPFSANFEQGLIVSSAEYNGEGGCEKYYILVHGDGGDTLVVVYRTTISEAWAIDAEMVEDDMSMGGNLEFVNSCLVRCELIPYFSSLPNGGNTTIEKFVNNVGPCAYFDYSGFFVYDYNLIASGPVATLETIDDHNAGKALSFFTSNTGVAYPYGTPAHGLELENVYSESYDGSLSKLQSRPYEGLDIALSSIKFSFQGEIAIELVVEDSTGTGTIVYHPTIDTDLFSDSEANIYLGSALVSAPGEWKEFNRNVVQDWLKVSTRRLEKINKIRVRPQTVTTVYLSSLYLYDSCEP